MATKLLCAGLSQCRLVDFVPVSMRVATRSKFVFTNQDWVALDAWWVCGWGVESIRQWVRVSVRNVCKKSKKNEKNELGHGVHCCLEVVVGQF
jgi:hypothetical protein